MGPPAPDDTGPPPAHRPPSVVTTSRSSPWSASTPATRPARTCGDLGAPAPPLLPHQPTGTWPWTGSPGRPGGERGAAAWTPAKQRQVWRRPSCEPRTANVRPSFARQARFGQRRPSRSPTTATRRTRCTNRGRSRRTDVFRIQRGCSGRGHRTRVRPDTRITPVVWTPGAWTPDAWTPDARTPDVHPTSWTDVRPHGGQRTRTERRTAWQASGHPGRHDDGDHRMGSQSSLGLPRLRRSATP
jgi:hypothetical protein